jgi:phosphoenolpyruvate carboxykinase (ATP)
MKTTKFWNSKTTIMSNVPSEILNPRNTWENPELYDEKHWNLLKNSRNFAKFEEFIIRDYAGVH